VIIARRRTGALVGLLLTLIGLTVALNVTRDIGWW
jgi:hypothetical protein